MSHVFRFFARPKNGEKNSPTWLLDVNEIEHARKVLKIKIGDTIEVMDGAGSCGEGTVVTSSRDEVSVEVSSISHEPVPDVTKALILGALKPGDFDDVLADLVELGLDQVHVFHQEGTAHFRTSDKAKERWERILVSSMKQSKRAWKPLLEVHDSLALALTACASIHSKYVLDAKGTSCLLDEAVRPTTSIAAVVGGERGLDDREIKQCVAAGFSLVRLGPYVLRAKTAAPAVATVLGMTRRTRV